MLRNVFGTFPNVILYWWIRRQALLRVTAFRFNFVYYKGQLQLDLPQRNTVLGAAIVSNV